MIEMEIKYFLNGVETKKEDIDWNRSSSITVKNKNEAHVQYMSYLLDKDKPTCGMSTRHKACNTGYPRPLSSGRKEEKEINDFLKLIGMIPLDIRKISEDFNKGLERTSSADELTTKRNTLQETYGKPTTAVGVKHNKHKAPLDIVQTRQFPKALQLVALATAFGNKKYEATDKDFLNFKRVPGGSQTYFDAAARHNTERNEIDEDSGLPHVIHAVWDMLAGLELLCEERGVDLKEFSKKYLEKLHSSK